MRAAARALLLLLVAAAAAAGDYYYDDDYQYDPSQHQPCVPAGSPTATIHCAADGALALCRGVRSAVSSAPASLRIALRAAGGNSSDGDAGPAYCASLLAIERGDDLGCYEILTFRNFTVGWAEDSDDTAEDGSPTVIVNLLSSMAHVKQLLSDSSTSEFWDFSNPVFSVESGLLTSVSFNREVRSRRCQISLANIYNLGGTSIEELSVYNNDQSDTGVRFGPMSKLKELRLVNCYLGIHKFPDDAHVQMPALEVLDLSNNLLPTVPAAVAGMQRLRVLDLSASGLTRLAGQLPALPRLSQLSLRGAQLCCLHQEPAAFRGVPSLQLLDLSHNRLTSLGAALRGLHRLSTLDASSNQLDQYPQLRLQGHASLNFAHNLLVTLPHCSQFGSNSSHLTLELQSNQISHWDGGPDMLRCVDSLDLANNSLATIDADMLSSLEAVRAVGLSGNPVHCEGCAFAQLLEWLRTTAVAAWAGARDTQAAAGLRCASPPAARGLPLGEAAGWASCRAQGAAGGGGGGALLAAGVAGAALLALGAAAGALAYRHRYQLAYTAHLLRLRARARASRRKAADDDADLFLFDAFILYSGSDQSFVGGRLLRLLEGEAAYRVCLHQRGLDGGAALHLSHLLDCSRHVIVVLSRSFLTSTWCRWEMDLANHRTLDPSQREFIILLELEPLERALLPRHLRFLMDTRTYLEWHQPADHQYEEQAFRRLRQALGPRASAARQSRSSPRSARESTLANVA